MLHAIITNNYSDCISLSTYSGGVYICITIFEKGKRMWEKFSREYKFREIALTGLTKEKSVLFVPHVIALSREVKNTRENSHLIIISGQISSVRFCCSREINVTREKFSREIIPKDITSVSFFYHMILCLSR